MLSCQRVPVVVKVDMKSRSVDCVMQNAEIAETVDISRTCAGKVRNQMSSRPSRSSGKGCGESGKSRNNTDKCYC